MKENPELMLMMIVIVLTIHNYFKDGMLMRELRELGIKNVYQIVLIMRKEFLVPTIVDVKILMKYILMVLMVILQVVMVNV